MSVRDAQQFHHNLVHYLRKTVTFEDGVVSLGWVPRHAVIMDAGVAVAEAFNAGTTNTLDIGVRNQPDGTADDPDAYASSITLGTVGSQDADELGTSAALYLENGAEIIATVKGTGTDATAGKAVVFVTYLADNDAPLPELA